MRKYSLSLSLALFVLLFNACDKVEVPIPRPPDIIVNDSISFPKVDSIAMNRSFKKTYVEEFTGHKCITCPYNTALLLQQYAENKERMIIASVHAGNFAIVDLPDYPTDFNTPYGTELFQHYNMATQPIPSAIINRRAFPNYNNLKIFSNATTFWEGPIDYENTNTSTDFALGLAADFIDSLNLFYITASTEVINAVSGNYRILILCVEDSIVAEQLDGRVSEAEHPKKIVKDYMHRHVLRGKISQDLSIHGNVLFSGAKNAGDWLHHEVNATLPPRVVNKENLLIIGLIINEDTEEIVQSEEVHVHVK